MSKKEMEMPILISMFYVCLEIIIVISSFNSLNDKTFYVHNAIINILVDSFLQTLDNPSINLEISR